MALLTVNKWHAWAVLATFADTLQVSIEKLIAANLQAFLNHLGGVLVHAVFGGETEDMVDSAASISRGSVFADVLDAPISELAMSDDIDTSKYLVDARTLSTVSMEAWNQNAGYIPYLPRGSSRRCSGPQDYPSHRGRLHATCRAEPR
jgi:hypothetical protein